ncbi:sugar-binding domain-containing protein [Lysinibacillus sp. KU-BSD001]|uniref:sugar-binding transcriptional regulator n=1 Tax=Lysinibacillus sp. KU-BSD001 TaxID=3141328 RepID=UPI0036E6DDC4
MDESSLYGVGRKLIPEIDLLLKKRFRILQAIHIAGPIGRRTLAELLHATEREIRNETSLLHEQQLIDIGQKGMICTEVGYEVLEKLKTLYHELAGFTQKEQQLAKVLGIEKVIIIPESFQDEASRTLLGKEASQLLTNLAQANSKIAVTGGSSVACIAPYLQPNEQLPSAQFIAARGGIGEEMSLQANVLVAQFAQACHASYKTLFLPEFLSEQAYVAMKAEPSVQEMIHLYEQVHIVVHGIGTAEEMAEKRGSTEAEKRLLREKGAVGEAFGYYFDEQGEIVHQIRTICIQPEHVKNSHHVIAIAGGAQKAKAIKAYFKRAAQQTIFMTDEAAANEML